MAENQSSHRQEIEKIAVKSGALNSLLGVIAAFLLGTFTILGGIWLAFVGDATAGALVTSVGMAGLAGVFIYGTRSNKNERAEKNKHQ
ncbi:MAG: phage holin family protein [Oscillospiraceae bacterium]|nr:phage holin family protein [Oscillospiraceae bacterium]